MTEKIRVFYSPNEKGSGRETALAKACMDDNRFLLPEPKDIQVDVQFVAEVEVEVERFPRNMWLYGEYMGGDSYFEKQKVMRAFNCELKEPADYVSSVLGKDGHAYMQYLDMAEAGHRCMFLVLGSDWEINRAIYISLHGSGYRGAELDFQVQDYENRLRDFEAQCFGLNAPVFRWSIDKRKIPEEQKWPDPFKRLLSTAHKVLTGPSLAGYGPRPAENERESTAFQCLLRGIGPKISEEILKDYRVVLVPRLPYARPILEMPGIGQKRSEAIEKRVVMFYGVGLQ